MIRSDKAIVDFNLLVSSVVHAFVVNKLNSSDPMSNIFNISCIYFLLCKLISL